MAIPSLVMRPSAEAAGRLYSVLPNNGDGDFQFNRDSSATLINSKGLIQTVGYFGSELVTNGTFDTDSDWAKETGWTISGGKANYNGNAALSALYQFAVTSGVKYRISFDVLNYVSGSFKVYLSDGSLAGGSPLITANGSYVFDITSVGVLVLFRNVTSFIGSINNVSVKEVLGDRPRFNYEITNGLVGGCPSLLLEPASTNLITYSEAFDNAYWVKNSSTVTSGFMSPDGTLNAYKIIANANNSATAHSIYHNPGFSITSGLDYTTTAYLKYDNQQYAKLEFGSTGGMGFPLSQRSVVVDLINGTINTPVSPAKATIKKFTGGFYEVSLTTTSAASGVTSSGISFTDALGNNIITNGNESIIAFGIQAENLSYATSYIPTNGAIQTRAAETCFGAGTASTFSDSEGVLYAEISGELSGTNRYITLSDSAISDRVNIFFDASNNLKGFVNGISSISGGVAIQGTNKCAFKYKSGDIAFWVNGIEVGTSTATLSLTGLSQLSFNLSIGGNVFYGNVKDIRVYNEALTDAQLQTLTTL